ncbi:MAG: PIN domain-containing protein [Deltaproteobacteria bacterium]|nr:PIN domain-containing protein [Deltaproteobacteria bacterium]
MKRIFADSNVFLRFFTVDEAGEHSRAERLLREAAAGKLELVTGPPVFFEVAWTLRAAYRQPREKVLDVLGAILALPGLRPTDAAVAEEAIALSRTSGQEFADAYIVASARRGGADAIATFNRSHFERLGASLHAL